MTFQFTKEILKQIAPHGNPQLQESLVDPLNKWLPIYEINTLLRIEHFIGQTAEESDSFKTLKEYASGREYENRQDLGNLNPGDGVKYKGRGILQITGKANYKSIGDKLGIDLVNHPELAETPDVAVQTACLYWKTHNLNKYADDDDIETITRRVNGGLNGYAMRKQFVINADNAIGDFFPNDDGTNLNP